MANDLDELFNRQPPYTEEEVNKIIAHMRERRAAYLAGDKQLKEAVAKGGGKLSLEALGLGKKKSEAPKGSLDL